MKLLEEEDKKTRKYQKREQKGIKEGRHRTTMRPHRGTMDMFENKGSPQKIRDKPPSSCHDEIHHGTIVQNPNPRKTINRAILLHNYSFKKIQFSSLKTIQVS
jgi:hypothetical protein